MGAPAGGRVQVPALRAVAQLWGQKTNSSMTYKKLSRARRYYYKQEILERVDGLRLVYKFGWKEEEVVGSRN